MCKVVWTALLFLNAVLIGPNSKIAELSGFSSTYGTPYLLQVCMTVAENLASICDVCWPLPPLLAFAIEKNLHGVPNHKNDTDPCMIHCKIVACTFLFVQSSQPPLSNSTGGMVESPR